MTTGDRIKTLRTSKGLTQEELGDMIGIKKAAINKYETGLVVNLKRTTIMKLADALGVSPAKGVDRETGARVQIPPSAPKKPPTRCNTTSWGFPIFLHHIFIFYRNCNENSKIFVRS